MGEIYETINKVVDRTDELNICTDRFTLFMDLTIAWEKLNIDLDKLLTFKDIDFVHDIRGIQNQIDRKTKSFLNDFLPRCSK